MPVPRSGDRGGPVALGGPRERDADTFAAADRGHLGTVLVHAGTIVDEDEMEAFVGPARTGVGQSGARGLLEAVALPALVSGPRGLERLVGGARDRSANCGAPSRWRRRTSTTATEKSVTTSTTPATMRIAMRSMVTLGSPYGRIVAERRRAALSGRPVYRIWVTHAIVKKRRRPTLPGPFKPSTIGAEGLNCSVRNGKRCFPLASATENGETSPSPGLQNCTLANCVNHSPPTRESKYPSSPRSISTGLLSSVTAAYTSGLSPGGLPGLLLPQGDGRSHLEVGFPLRCFQRLSHPDVANQRCPWRDNWYTRGPFIPVLSY